MEVELQGVLLGRGGLWLFGFVLDGKHSLEHLDGIAYHLVNASGHV